MPGVPSVLLLRNLVHSAAALAVVLGSRSAEMSARPIWSTHGLRASGLAKVCDVEANLCLLYYGGSGALE